MLNNTPDPQKTIIASIINNTELADKVDGMGPYSIQKFDTAGALGELLKNARIKATSKLPKDEAEEIVKRISCLAYDKNKKRIMLALEKGSPHRVSVPGRIILDLEQLEIISKDDADNFFKNGRMTCSNEDIAELRERAARSNTAYSIVDNMNDYIKACLSEPLINGIKDISGLSLLKNYYVIEALHHIVKGSIRSNITHSLSYTTKENAKEHALDTLACHTNTTIWQILNTITILLGNTQTNIERINNDINSTSKEYKARINACKLEVLRIICEALIINPLADMVTIITTIIHDKNNPNGRIINAKNNVTPDNVDNFLKIFMPNEANLDDVYRKFAQDLDIHTASNELLIRRQRVEQEEKAATQKKKEEIELNKQYKPTPQVTQPKTDENEEPQLQTTTKQSEPEKKTPPIQEAPPPSIPNYDLSRFLVGTGLALASTGCFGIISNGVLSKTTLTTSAIIPINIAIMAVIFTMIEILVISCSRNTPHHSR